MGRSAKGSAQKSLWMGSSVAEGLESSLLGVGTGLGLAHCFPNNALVSATEFGHVSFAPFDETTMRLWIWWREQTDRRLTLRMCVFWTSHGDQSSELLFVTGTWTTSRMDESVRHNSRLGWVLSKNAETPFARAVWKLFFGILGSVCGDVIVGNRSHHLYLCGGVVEKNIHLFSTHQQTFEQAMKDKAPMTHLVEEATVMLFTDSKLQQYGCGIWYAHQQKS